VIRTEIIQRVRSKGEWTYPWNEIKGLIWGDDIEAGIDKWSMNNMINAIITYEPSPNENQIKEVTFVSSR
jgi:hypothetical protein